MYTHFITALSTIEYRYLKRT